LDQALTRTPLATGSVAVHPARAAGRPAAEAGGAARVVRLGDERFSIDLLIAPVRAVPDIGVRYDRTALVRQVQLDGRRFLHSPLGLVDEFGISGKGVLGYDTAAAGERFIKVGVGVLVRDTGDDYRFSHAYPAARIAPGTIVSQDERTVAIEQSAELDEWGYGYVKRYLVRPESGTLSIAYELTNTGRRTFPVEQYNHNWFRLDGRPIGPGYSVRADFAIDPLPGRVDWVRRMEDRLRIILAIGKPRYFPSQASSPAGQNRLALQHASGQQVLMEGDFAVRRFALYTDPRALCPEVFFAADALAPGQTLAWTRTYAFCLNARD
jgi:hypothetical protein